MKKAYLKPTTESVVLNPGESVAWGGNNASQGNYTDGKENDTSWDYIEEEDELDSKFAWSVWGDDEDEEEDY